MLRQTITVVNNYDIPLLLVNQDNDKTFQTEDSKYIFNRGTTTTHVSSDFTYTYTPEGVNSIIYDVYIFDKTVKIGSLPRIGFGDTVTIVVEKEGIVDVIFEESEEDEGKEDGGKEGDGKETDEGMNVIKIVLITGGILLVIGVVYRKLNEIYGIIKSPISVIEKNVSTSGFNFY